MPAGAAERRHHEQAGPTARRDEEHGFPPAHRASSRGYATLVTSEIKLWSQVLGIFFGASIVLVRVQLLFFRRLVCTQDTVSRPTATRRPTLRAPPRPPGVAPWQVVYSGRMAKSIAYGARSASSSFATPARPRPDLDDSPEARSCRAFC